MTLRKPNIGRFSILDAARKGLRDMMLHGSYLVRVGVVPMIASVLAAIVVSLNTKDDVFNLITNFLWGLPAEIFLGWFLFVYARLLVLGERVDRLDSDVEFRRHRQQLLRASVIIFVLFKMFMAGCHHFILWVMENRTPDGDTPLKLATLVLIGVLFWSLRLAALPVLAAVDYPLKRFLFGAHGAGLSFQLFALLLLSYALPLLMTGAFVAQLAQQFSLGTTTQLAILHGFAFVFFVWLIGAGCDALRQMLARDKIEVK